MDDERMMMQRRIDNLCEQLELVKRQRDALMSEVAGHCWACKNAKPSEIGRSLFTCEFLPSVGMIRSKCEHWEWRGVQENGGADDGETGRENYPD